MFDQSISGIRTNLEAFSQAATRVANPYAAIAPSERSNDRAAADTGTASAAERNRTPSPDATRAANAEAAYRNAGAASRKSEDVAAEDSAATRDKEAYASKELADKPSGKTEKPQSVDQAAETVKMMVAKQGVEANSAALKTALALSGQTVDILA